MGGKGRKSRNTHIPNEFLTQGAKLLTLNQATAYQGIRRVKSSKDPRAAAEQLDCARQAIEAISGDHETDETIWTSTRKPVIRTRVSQFLYKAMHQTHMVGAVWRHIQRHNQRQFCTACQDLDSMDHILTKCPTNTRRLTWSLAEQAWPHTQECWPEISLGLILRVGCISFPNPDTNNTRTPPDQRRKTNKRKGASRLLQILISKTAHLTWVMRCERTIQNKQHTDDEIRARWLQAINDRLTYDRIIAVKIKRNAKHTNLVKHTWEPVKAPWGLSS